MQTAGTTGSGLSMVKEIYSDPSQRARQLKSQGKKVMGYYCCYSPAEIMSAANLLPYRIRGDMHETITKGDAYMDTYLCTYLRSTFDLAVKGRFDFLDGVVAPSTCNNIRRFDLFWRDYVKPAYARHLNVPHSLRPVSFDFFEAELAAFKKSLEDFTAVEISDKSLNEAIELYNENRGLLRELCELRKADPPLLSGVEMLETIIAGLCIPVDEANSMVRGVIKDVTSRQESREKRARLLVYGSIIDSTDFIQLVEDCGANVVIDDLCFGTKAYWHDVEISDNPIGDLARYYLGKIMCPRTYRDTTEDRFGYIESLAKDFQVDGVILYAVRFCDPVEIEVPALKDYLQQSGFPVLYLEDDYTTGGFGMLKTRIQAFVEMIR